MRSHKATKNGTFLEKVNVLPPVCSLWGTGAASPWLFGHRSTVKGRERVATCASDAVRFDRGKVQNSYELWNSVTKWAPNSPVISLGPLFLHRSLLFAHIFRAEKRGRKFCCKVLLTPRPRRAKVLLHNWWFWQQRTGDFGSSGREGWEKLSQAWWANGQCPKNTVQQNEDPNEALWKIWLSNPYWYHPCMVYYPHLVDFYGFHVGKYFFYTWMVWVTAQQPGSKLTIVKSRGFLKPQQVGHFRVFLLGELTVNAWSVGKPSAMLEFSAMFLVFTWETKGILTRETGTSLKVRIKFFRKCVFHFYVSRWRAEQLWLGIQISHLRSKISTYIGAWFAFGLAKRLPGQAFAFDAIIFCCWKKISRLFWLSLTRSIVVDLICLDGFKNDVFPWKWNASKEMADKNLSVQFKNWKLSTAINPFI